MNSPDITEALGEAYARARKKGAANLDLDAMRSAVGELLEKGTILVPSPDGIAWADIGIAAMNPLRRRILEYLGEHGMASPNEMSKALKEGLSQISYHVKELYKPTNTRNPSLIEMVKTEPRRGAVEHYYRRREEPVYEKADRRRKRPRSKASAGV